jgi:hypothetical protein
MIAHLQRVCAKLYAAEPAGVADETFVPIFHEWIRKRALDAVLLDVADYTHAPDSPGVMLIGHDATYALDRSDGRFGLLVQRRRPTGDGGADAIAAALRGLVAVADKLEADRRLLGKLSFDRSVVRVEANDRLRAPNTDASFEAFEPVVRDAVARVFAGPPHAVVRVANDARHRLAVDVHRDRLS